MTQQLYKDFKLIYKISKITNLSIFPNIAFITAPMTNSYAILYNLATKTLQVICLHFIEKQCIIFALLAILEKQIEE